MAVDDDQLTVVSIVHLTRKRRESHGQERHHLYPLVTHAVEKGMTHVPTPHIVVDQLHLHPLARLVYQRIREQRPQRVFGKDIHIDMDMALCLGDLCQKGREESIAIVIHRHLIILEGQREVLVHEEVYQLSVLSRQLQVLLLHKLQHRTFGELVQTPLADELLLAGIQPEEEVEHQSHHRHEPYHQRPGHRLGRLTVVHHHMDDCQDDDHLIDTE